MHQDKKDRSFTQGSGYRIYHNVFDSEICQQVFNHFTIELCFFVFRERASDLIRRYEMGVTTLFNDKDKRRALGIPDNLIRRNGNPRESKILKKSGKTALYTSPYVRNGIRRNPILRTLLTAMYGTDKLAYTSGLEHVLYKPKGTSESPAVLDCRLLEPLGPMTAVENPFHYTGFVCVSDGSAPLISSSNGLQGMETSSESESTETSPREHHSEKTRLFSVLENFDFHYENLKGLMSPHGPCPLSKQKKQLDITILENLNLDVLNRELQNIHARTNNPTSAFRPLRWIEVPLHEGDFVVFDCRLPYKTGKTTGDRPIMLVPISLRPVSSEWYTSTRHYQLVEGITKGKIGNWAKRTSKGCNINEVTWRTTESDLPNSRITVATNTADFTASDRLIFGLDRYPM